VYFPTVSIHIGSITSPTLVLTGEFFEESAAEFTNHIPMSRYERFPNAGHLGHIDNPEVFNEMVSRFLREVYVGEGAV
jgi:pimeloyl-ACP methyl ester carboxylesterase